RTRKGRVGGRKGPGDDPDDGVDLGPSVPPRSWSRARADERADGKDQGAGERGCRPAPYQRDPEEGERFFRRGGRPHPNEVSPFIDEERSSFGVAPICRVLGVPERSYYAARSRPVCHRALTDAEHLVRIRRCHEQNYKAYGSRRIHKQLKREGYKVAKCTVERLMNEHHIKGVIRGKPHFTTHPAEGATRAADLVERQFHAARPDELWVSDITYGKTAQGFLYACFIEDVLSRMIVGWHVSDNLRAELVTDALEVPLWRRIVE